MKNPEHNLDEYGTKEDPEVFVSLINRQNQLFKNQKDSVQHSLRARGSVTRWWLRFLQTFVENNHS